jgi:hypothetical protein
MQDDVHRVARLLDAEPASGNAGAAFTDKAAAFLNGKARLPQRRRNPRRDFEAGTSLCCSRGLRSADDRQTRDRREQHSPHESDDTTSSGDIPARWLSREDTPRRDYLGSQRRIVRSMTVKCAALALLVVLATGCSGHGERASESRAVLYQGLALYRPGATVENRSISDPAARRAGAALRKQSALALGSRHRQ